jgi:hypothetical protein
MSRTMKSGITVLAKDSNNLTAQPMPVSLKRVCIQIDQSDSDAVVRKSLLVEVWEAEEPPLL